TARCSTSRASNASWDGVRRCRSTTACAGPGAGCRSAPRGNESRRPVDAPLEASDALIRPWRTATLVASLVAAVELVLLLAAAFLLLAKPLSHAMQRHAEATAFTPTHR